MHNLSLLGFALCLMGCSDNAASGVDTGSGATTSTSGGSGSSGGSGGVGGTNFSACDTVGSCVLAQPGCCPVCTVPTLDDVEPIRSDLLEAFRDATCNGVELCACDGLINPNLFAVCEEGACVEGDLKTSVYSACSAASDCVLLPGLACCACDVPVDQWVAISNDTGGTLLGTLCGDVDCEACEVPPPANLVADCVEGHCIVAVTDL